MKDVEVGEIARREQAAVVEAIEQSRIAALALHRMFERDTVSLAVAHPMLEHEGRRSGVADRPAMRAAVGQAVHRVVRRLQILEEIEVAVAVVQNREIDETLALVLHQQVIRSEEHTSELQSLMRISY